jgi:DNA-binding SARP family transcriptional activator
LPKSNCAVKKDNACITCYNTAPVLHFRLLGPLEVTDAARPIPLGGRLQRKLLALLVLDAGRTISTDRLIDSIWGDAPPRTAATSLQNAVSALRKLLGSDTVVTRPPGYALAVDRDQVDAARFERLLQQARDAGPEERATGLREALALWRGPPLADFSFEQFAQAEIRRLEELRLVALEERIAADVELGRHADVAGELEGLIAEHPLREGLLRLQMLALYRSGRQAEALQAFQHARLRFVEGLGIEPGHELQELHRAILRQDTELRPTSADAAPQDVEGAISDALLGGRLVPVLGLAGSAALAEQLARTFDYPRDRPLDLARVCQYVATMKGAGPLHDELHDHYRSAIEPEPLHRFLARLPPLLRERGVPHQLIVETNYDLGLERAFEDAGEELDVVAYVAAGTHRGRFWHRAPGRSPQPIEVPNAYADLSLERRTVLLKLRGAVDLVADSEWESFVATEDDHIEYLGGTDLATAVPVTLAARLRRSHFLFLGYEMADWNLRLVLTRLRGPQPPAYGSWSVQAQPSPLERAFWRRFDVDLLDCTEADFLRLLEARLGAAVAW